MNCKSVQQAVGVGQALTDPQQAHLRQCAQCQAFESGALVLQHQVQDLEAQPPHHLQGDIWAKLQAGRKPRPYLQWGITVAAIAIVAAPAWTVFKARAEGQNVKAMSIGQGLPFHMTMKGRDISFGNEEDVDLEAWYDGTHLRRTDYRVGTGVIENYSGIGSDGKTFEGHGPVQLDKITWPENGYIQEWTKAEGELKHTVSLWANGDHPNEAPKPVTADWFGFFLSSFAPSVPEGITPSKGAPQSITVMGRTISTTPYRYVIHGKKGAPLSHWNWENDSVVTVYRAGDKGSIMRIMQEFANDKGGTDTLIMDYEYSVMSSSTFDSASLSTYTNTYPAMQSSGK